MITSTEHKDRLRRRCGASRSGAGTCRPAKLEPEGAPIVVAVEDCRAAAAAAQAAVSLARELAAPLVFVYVRRGPSAAFGEPYYQRRLDARMRAGRRAWTTPSHSPIERACPPPASSSPGAPPAASEKASRARSSAAPTARSSSPAEQRGRPLEPGALQTSAEEDSKATFEDQMGVRWRAN